jgi:transcriptional regulator with XRE-family HTH domain
VFVSNRPAKVGEVIRFWRERRRLTQLDVSVETGISTRHLSCVETGRAQPSRDLLGRIAEHLQLPLAERNRLLLAGGYAPIYADVPLDAAGMKPLRRQLRRLLLAHEPNPALILDRHWNLVEANSAAALLTDGVDDRLLEPPINVLRLALDPDGLPRISTNSPSCSIELLRRVRRTAHENADDDLLALVCELEGYLPERTQALRALEHDQVLSFFELKTSFGGVRLFTVIAQLASPMEVTSAGLAIETFLPADDESARLLDELRRRDRGAPNR